MDNCEFTTKISIQAKFDVFVFELLPKWTEKDRFTFYLIRKEIIKSPKN